MGQTFFALLLLAFWPTASLAQVDQGKALAAIEAARDLLADIEAAPTPQEVPRLSDPDTLRIFSTALDSSVASGGAEVAAGLSLLFDLQRSAGALIRAYLLNGIKARSLSSDLSGEQAARNFIAFQPELARLFDFRVQLGSVIAVSAVAMEENSPSSPVVSSALAAIADEQEKVLRSVLAAASDPQIDPQWRSERVLVLKQTQPGFIRLLGKKKSQELADRALAAAIAERDNTVAALMKDFAIGLLR